MFRTCEFLFFRNPNRPNKLAVDWHQFTTGMGQFLQLKTGDTKVIDTPNKEKNERIVKYLFSAGRKQFPIDVPRERDLTTYPTTCQVWLVYAFVYTAEILCRKNSII